MFIYACTRTVFKSMSLHMSEGEMSSCLFALLRLANPCLMLTDVGDSTALLL